MDMKNVFDSVCNCLEIQSEPQTVSSLAMKMKELSGDKECYTNKRIKDLLKERYESRVVFESLGSGKDDLVLFNTAQEKEQEIIAVANLIKNEIADISQSDCYPLPTDLNDMDTLSSWIPPSLKKLLGIIIPNDLKKIAIGHAITAASQTSLHSPLLFGLGVQLDHSFGSKWLTSHLSRLRFCKTYHEIRKFKKAAMETENIDPIIPPGSFAQWSADNVDHNCRTLDGKNTFHGMGIVLAITPSLSTPSAIIKRGSTSKGMKDISGE